MNFQNKFARFMRNTGPARFLVPVGLVLIIFGIILLGFNHNKYVETVGRITSVSEGIFDDETNQQQYDIDFTYTVDGKEYNGTFSNLSEKYGVGEDIKVFYDPEDPTKTTNSKLGGILAPVIIGLGVLAAALGVFMTVKAFRKSKALDAAVGKFPHERFEGIKQASGVTEYYFRWDGNSLKPGYLIEDASRNVLFEGKMLKNALVGAREFEFNDHTTGTVRDHQVGHTSTQSFNDEAFSAKSSFKFDGENVWDVIHDRGIRIATNMLSKFPYFVYDIARDGEPFARVESTSQYVHEDDEAQHNVVIPVGHMYYRIWTPSNDFDSLFLTIFAISESEQAVVE